MNAAPVRLTMNSTLPSLVAVKLAKAGAAVMLAARAEAIVANVSTVTTGWLKVVPFSVTFQASPTAGVPLRTAPGFAMAPLVLAATGMTP